MRQRYYRKARRDRRFSEGMLVAVVFGFASWAVGEWVGRGVFGLEGVWAWVVGVVCVVVIGLGAILVVRVVRGNGIDWR